MLVLQRQSMAAVKSVNEIGRYIIFICAVTSMMRDVTITSHIRIHFQKSSAQSPQYFMLQTKISIIKWFTVVVVMEKW